jgi:hypothetical protein
MKGCGQKLIPHQRTINRVCAAASVVGAELLGGRYCTTLAAVVLGLAEWASC